LIALPKANAQLFPGRNNQPAVADTNGILQQRSKETDSLLSKKPNALLKGTDSTTVDTLKKKQVGDLKTTVKYVAEDSMVFDVKNKTFYLYKKSKVKKPINGKTLLSALQNYYKNEQQKAEDLTKHVLNSREEQIKETIKRKIDK
jgi:hypothetical protein